jgi:hypothetical protein
MPITTYIVDTAGQMKLVESVPLPLEFTVNNAASLFGQNMNICSGALMAQPNWEQEYWQLHRRLELLVDENARLKTELAALKGEE